MLRSRAVCNVVFNVQKNRKILHQTYFGSQSWNILLHIRVFIITNTYLNFEMYAIYVKPCLWFIKQYADLFRQIWTQNMLRMTFHAPKLNNTKNTVISFAFCLLISNFHVNFALAWNYCRGSQEALKAAPRPSLGLADSTTNQIAATGSGAPPLTRPLAP